MAQYINLGWNSQPNDTCSVALPNYMGDFGDFGNGYATGDTVADFKVYDFFGQQLHLYSEFEENKPIILINGSVTCGRFNDFFDPNILAQDFLSSRQYVLDHENDFNWIFIYGMEAHPTDGACPSNCPPIITVDTTAYQHPDYHYRRYALYNWMQSDEHDFPFKMYCDNPDNAVYETFFARPFGILILNCDGTVMHSGEWANSWILQNFSVLDDLIQSDYSPCELAVNPETEEEEEEEEPGPHVGVLLEDPNIILEESEYTMGTTGVNENSNNKITVFPNPSQQSWTVNGISSESELYLYSADGRLIEYIPFCSQLETIDAYILSDGIYQLIIINRNTNSKNQIRLIKQ